MSGMGLGGPGDAGGGPSDPRDPEGLTPVQLTNIAAVLPREAAEYYAALDHDRFPPRRSQFRDVTSLEELLRLAAKQRGDLFGDDRKKLAAMGAHRDTFAGSEV